MTFRRPSDAHTDGFQTPLQTPIQTASDGLQTGYSHTPHTPLGLFGPLWAVQGLDVGPEPTVSMMLGMGVCAFTAAAERGPVRLKSRPFTVRNMRQPTTGAPPLWPTKKLEGHRLADRRLTKKSHSRSKLQEPRR
jgi:hypothetical protein